jgi:hypothetical protein
VYLRRELQDLLRDVEQLLVLPVLEPHGPPLLVGEDLTLRPITGPSPARDVYALLPPGDRHPLVAPTLDALNATAAELQRPTGP